MCIRDSLLASAGNLARRGIYIRNLHSLEVLAKTQTVLFDKTGTLTQDKQSIEQIITPSGSVDLPNIEPQQLQALQCALGLAQTSWHPVSRILTSDLSLKLGLNEPDRQRASFSTWFTDIQEISGQGLQAQGQLLSSLHPLAPHSSSCLLYTSPSPRDGLLSRMPSSA